MVDLVYIKVSPVFIQYRLARTLKTLVTSLQSGHASLAMLEGGSCTVPEVVVTVLCIPDDGRNWHPKHVEWIILIVINKCTCIKFHIKTLKIAPTCFDPRIILKELRCSLLKSFLKHYVVRDWLWIASISLRNTRCTP